MKIAFEEYIQNVSSKFSHTETGELGYRTDFENLLKKIFEEINVRRIDHDPKAKEHNKPDFIVLKNDIPILYIEAKDIGVSLNEVEKSEQMGRYYGYTNLILTDYLEFRFYRNGLYYGDPIKIANYDLKTREITPLSENYDHLAKTFIDFSQSEKEPIRSGKHLSKIMGGKAQRIRDNVRQIFASDVHQEAEIARLYEIMKKLLVHDLTIETFGDMYAQTLVYGLFVARYHDSSPENFTRLEARGLVPASNPFLGHFFDHIAGRNFEKRLSYIVDELCEVFSHANIRELMTQYFKDDLWGQTHIGPDPIIHFYEDFLKEYDPNLRKKMGAYYTPLPIVSFIVKAVDIVLRRDFGLSRGLADTEKNNEDVHRVQILDPAVGTGTFLSMVIDTIHKQQISQQQAGNWASYVHHELLPRVYGFELMMAPYTIAHLKISIKLDETGFKYFNETRDGKTRLGVYLTNSLEDAEQQQELFAFDLGAAISEEAKDATRIKNEKPIMVVVGNPPYSVSSQNKGTWIQSLIKDYKSGLNERKINLDDDYIKFIRFSEHFVEKNKTGIVAMITNNSFIDGITHRQMRKHLLETFDDIYILDLHGNSKKKEKAPDGGKDENVFDIQQGVAISIFVRKDVEKKHTCKVYHAEIFGKRLVKFEKLNESNIENIKWKTLDLKDFNEKFSQTTWGKQFGSALNFFTPKGTNTMLEYGEFFGVSELFREHGSGIITRNDKITIQHDKQALDRLINDFKVLSEVELREKYRVKDGTNWKLKNAIEDVVQNEGLNKVFKIVYRPFDFRYTLFTQKSGGFLNRPVFSTMKHMAYTNLSLNTARIVPPNQDWDRVFVSETVSDIHSASDQTYVFPLYLYSDNGVSTPNFNEEVIAKIEKKVGKVIPEDIFDYVYAILYSPDYRKKYNDLLKIDFPRIPYPKDPKQFQEMFVLGRELRKLHLFKSSKMNQFITSYPVQGSNIVGKVVYTNGNLYINKEQYFGNVPEKAWNFYIGGYQPAQRWLKDRKDRPLTSQDIEHFQKIIIALAETDNIMKKIDIVVKS